SGRSVSPSFPATAGACSPVPGCQGIIGMPRHSANDTGPYRAKNATSILIAIVITALYSVVCVVGLLGNILVMYGIVRYTKMKTATNIYIFNLALADALATSTLPFQSAKYLMETWPFGELLCKVVLSIDYYNMFTSIFTLTMMSVDRYIAVCHPVKALDFRTPAKAKIINVCIWVLSSIIGVPIMVMAVTKSKGKCWRRSGLGGWLKSTGRVGYSNG
uniref:Opioid receptor delta 1 n=1 Tax=Apteryx owenii TaxID=8824 RepID=A0A8B9QER7_APTOW